MSSLFGSECVSSCPAELSVEIRFYMPLCGGDVPSGKGGTNAGGARLERQKLVRLHEAACCSSGWYPHLPAVCAAISENIHQLHPILQHVQPLEHLRQGSHFFLMLVLFPKSFP